MSAQIVVLGSLNIDLVLQLPRLPQPGDTVLGGELRRFPGGKGANQALAARRLGGEVAMVGCVGADSSGEAALALLSLAGVDVSGVGHLEGQETGTALILVGPDGDNMISVAPGANQRVGEREVFRALEALAHNGLLVMQLEIPPASVHLAAEGAHRQGARVLLNASPSSEDQRLLELADILVVNRGEASALLGQAPAGQRDALEVARAASQRGVGLAVVTLGSEGAVFAQGSEVQHVAPFEVRAVDATAAGDAFVGALAVCVAGGLSASEAVRLANAAGAVAATRPGAQDSLPTPADLRSALGVEWPAELGR